MQPHCVFSPITSIGCSSTDQTGRNTRLKRDLSSPQTDGLLTNDTHSCRGGARERRAGVDPAYAAVVQIDLVALIVDDYDSAIAFFSDVLGFDLVEDSPSLTNDGRPKR